MVLRRVHGSLAKPIECKNCGFFHNSKKDLKKHHKANAQNGRCKRNRNIIKKYREKVAAQEKNPEADGESETILLNGGIRRKTLKQDDLVKKVPMVSACPECDEKFSNFIEMDSHFRTSHDRK